ncbi:MAG: DMT family transporter [Anaerolineales bacterium]|nr:DMT family transporter [Anaerolineales bacterium]
MVLHLRSVGAQAILQAGLRLEESAHIVLYFMPKSLELFFFLPCLYFSMNHFQLQNVSIFSFLAGMVGTIGLMLLYHAMSIGMMSIAAPVSALLAAVLPVVVGIFTEGLPDFLTLIGFGFALFAVWMISQGENGIKDIRSHLTDLKLPLLAGIGFGFYYILMHQATSDSDSTIWPLIFARLGGVILVICYLIITRSSLKIDITALPIISVNGILDLGGNFFFILASRVGRLDVSAVLSSLFPGATVLLASIFLKERLTRNQWFGVIAALMAIILMTI